MKLDHFYHLVDLDYCLHLYWYIHNVLADVSFRCFISNSGANTELQTKHFIQSMEVDSQFRHETLGEGQKMYQSKHFEYNNKDEDNSLNTLNDKNLEVSSQKFRQIIYLNQIKKAKLNKYIFFINVIQ